MNLILLFIYLIPCIIFIVLRRKSINTGSDHYVHLLFIDLIKNNNKKFIITRDNTLNTTYMNYPQLLHWFIAVLPKKMGELLIQYLNIFVLLFQSGTHFVFLMLIFDWKIEGNEMEFILSALMYISIPYHFNAKNAKNVGLSSRGIGVFLVQILLLIFFKYNISGDFIWLFFAVIPNILIILTSRFAYQYLLFGLPLLSLFLFDVGYVLTFLVGNLIYLFLFPKTSIKYYKGQFLHKKVYYKYMSDKILSKMTKTVIKSFFESFIDLLFFVRHPEKYFYRFERAMKNQLNIVIFQMGIIVLYLVFNSSHDLIKGQNYLLYLSIISLILFLGTISKYTRFLGEAERYVEFPLIVLAVSLFYEIEIICSILIINFGGIIFNIYQIKKNESTSSLTAYDFNEIKKWLLETNSNEEVRFVAMTTKLNRQLRNSNLKQFDFVLIQEVSDNFHIADVFNQEYESMNINIVGRMINEYQLNYIILNELQYEEFIVKYNGEFDLDKKLDKKHSVYKIKKALLKKK